MSKQRKSIAQAKRERSAAREIKRQELIAVFRERKRIFQELLEREPKDLDEEAILIAEVIRERRLLNVETEDEYVSHHLRIWEGQQPILVTGTYKDDNLTKARFQRRFVETLITCSPNTFEELRPNAPVFQSLFVTDKNSFHDLFDWSRLDSLNDALFEMDEFLRSKVYSQIHRAGTSGMINFDDSDHFQYDYKWGNFKPLFEFIRLSKSWGDDIYQDRIAKSVSERIRQMITLSTSTASTSAYTQLLNGLSNRVVNDSYSGRESLYFVEKGIQGVIAVTKEVIDSASEQVEVFVSLMLSLFDWARENFLEKDWLLRYAFHFLSTFSETDGDSPVPLLQEFLVTDRFAAGFEPWLPGVESRESYEKRLRKKLDEAIHNFFDTWGRHLNLDRLGNQPLRRVTRPPDPDFESLRWLIAWNEGATHAMIAKEFAKTEGTIIKGLKLLHQFDLPIRTGSRAEGLTKPKSERLRQIRLADLSRSLSVSSKDN